MYDTIRDVGGRRDLHIAESLLPANLRPALPLKKILDLLEVAKLLSSIEACHHAIPR